jgi:hypothetical protein
MSKSYTLKREAMLSFFDVGRVKVKNTPKYIIIIILEFIL